LGIRRPLSGVVSTGIDDRRDLVRVSALFWFAGLALTPSSIFGRRFARGVFGRAAVLRFTTPFDTRVVSRACSGLFAAGRTGFTFLSAAFQSHEFARDGTDGVSNHAPSFNRGVACIEPQVALGPFFLSDPFRAHLDVNTAGPLPIYQRYGDGFAGSLGIDALGDARRVGARREQRETELPRSGRIPPARVVRRRDFDGNLWHRHRRLQDTIPTGIAAALHCKSGGQTRCIRPMVCGYYPSGMSRLGAVSSRTLFRVIPGGARAGTPDEDSTISDEAIVSAVRRGDSRLASELCSRVVGAVDHTLYRVVGQRGIDHDDLVQQSFEQIVLTLTRGTFAHGCSLRTWASRVATNVGLNALRSRRRERAVVDRSQSLDPDFDIFGGPDPRGRLEARAELNHVREQLAEMNPRQVEILMLHDVLGHGLREISLTMGMSRTAVQSRLFRGRGELRRRLETLGLGSGGGQQ